jgi:hypothetical protein
VLAWLAPDYKNNLVYDVVQYSCLSASIFTMIGITIFNYILGGYIFKSFETLVKQTLDKFLEKLNKDIFLARGLEWYVVPNHYWIELRILVNRSTPNSNKAKYNLFSPSSSVMEVKSPFSNTSVAAPIPQFLDDKKNNNLNLESNKFHNGQKENQITMKNIRSPKDTSGR